MRPRESHMLVDLARAGVLWTGAQHHVLSRPVPPGIARYRLSDWERSGIQTLLRALVEREATFHTPTLLRKSDGFDRLLPIGVASRYPFDRFLAAMIACEFIAEVPEAELLKFCRSSVDEPPRPCLPLRQYWGEGARGFLVTERGRREAAA